MGSVPRFETTSAALYGRFVFFHRGSYTTTSATTPINTSSMRTFHHLSTAATSALNAARSFCAIIDG